MTLSELRLKITGDDQEATDALLRVRKELRRAKEDSDSLSRALAESMRAGANGATQSAAQSLYGEGISDLKKQSEAAAKAVKDLQGQLDSLASAVKAHKLEQSELHSAAIAQLTAQAGSPQDLESIRLYGKMFDDLAPRSKEIVEQIVRMRQEAELLSRMGPPGWIQALSQGVGMAVESIQKAREQLSQDVAAQMESYRQATRLAQANTEEEKALWQTQEGRLKGVHPWIQAILVLQARTLDQTREQAKAERDLSKIRDDAGRNQDRLIDTRLTERVADLRAGIAKLLGVAEPYADILERIGADTNDLTDKQKALLNQIGKLAEVRDAVATVVQGLKSTVHNVLDDIYNNGFKGLFSSVISGFRDMMRRLAEEYLESQLTRLLMRGLSGPFGGAVMAGSAFAVPPAGWQAPMALPGRASGGPVAQEMTYVVGEQGPELFVPKQSGTVLSNFDFSALAAKNSAPSSVVVHNHFNISTPEPGAFRKSMSQIAAEAGAAMNRSVQRNR